MKQNNKPNLDDTELLKTNLRSFKFPAKYTDYVDTTAQLAPAEKTHYGYTDNDLAKLKGSLETFKFPNHETKSTETTAPSEIVEDDYFKNMSLDTYQFPNKNAKQEHGFLEKMFKKQVLPVEMPKDDATGETPLTTPNLPKLQYNAWRTTVFTTGKLARMRYLIAVPFTLLAIYYQSHIIGILSCAIMGSTFLYERHYVTRQDLLSLISALTILGILVSSLLYVTHATFTLLIQQL